MNQANIKATAMAFAVEIMGDEDDFDEVMQMANEIYNWLVRQGGEVINMKEVN